jgi:hypothetical protein
MPLSFFFGFSKPAVCAEPVDLDLDLLDLYLDFLSESAMVWPMIVEIG